MAVIHEDRAKVRATPESGGEVLHSLRRGERVGVLRQKGAWTQIQVKVGKDFDFKGWVRSTALQRKDSTIRTRRRPAPTQRKVNVYVTKENAALQEQASKKSDIVAHLPLGKAMEVIGKRGDWFNVKATVSGVGTRKGWVAKRNVSWKRPFRRGSARPTQPVRSPTRKPRGKRSTFVESSDSDGSFLEDRLSIGAGMGYSLYLYNVKSGGATIVDYSLSGLAAGIDVDYWFWESESKTLRAGGLLDYQLGYYFHKANVTDSSQNLVISEKKRSTSNKIATKVALDYRFDPEDNGTTFGLTLGFQYFRFSADDISVNSAPLNLFVSQTVVSLLGGLHAGMPVSENIVMGANVDILALNWLSESPANATGTGASAGLGFAPSLFATWVLGNHQIGGTYGLHFQNHSFSGSGSRVGTANVTDGKSRNMIHQLLIQYVYGF